MQVTNWYLPVSWISIIVTQTWCDSVLWWFSGVIHGQKWAKNQPKLDIWVIFEVWKGRKTAKNGSFLRPEVWPTDQILAQKKSGPQKFKSSQKKLIPAQLGKFLGSQVGQFWPSGGLRGPLVQKLHEWWIFRPWSTVSSFRDKRLAFLNT